jgi:Cu/Ag efflux protein CusF
MNRGTVNRIAMALTAATLLGGAAVAQTTTAVAKTEGKAGAAQISKVRVTVKAIDLAKREVTIQHEDGIVETITVGDAVQRLDEVRVGDTVDVEHYESVTLALDKKPGAAPSATGAAAEARTEPGELPGGVQVKKVTLSAKVTAIDAKANQVTLTGPEGNSVVLDVAPETLAKLKVGDVVEAVYTQAIAVAVSRVSK